jgi:hypothetical protein
VVEKHPLNTEEIFNEKQEIQNVLLKKITTECTEVHRENEEAKKIYFYY